MEKKTTPDLIQKQSNDMTDEEYKLQLYYGVYNNNSRAGMDVSTRHLPNVGDVV